MRSIPFGRPLLGREEQQAVLEVLEGPVLTHGCQVQSFERAFADFCGADYAVATASCTAAMQLAFMAAGIGPGDEVIVPALTHVATAHAVELCGGTCVFADSEPRTGNVDLDHVEALIGARTRAIAVMHYLGMPIDLDRAANLARRHSLFLLEDCALALGARYRGRHVGLHGDAGCFSFYPIKHITTAEGGMLITRDEALAQRCARQRAFGIDRNGPGERPQPGIYDVPLLGINARLNEIGAALGLQQLRRLPRNLERRRRNRLFLQEALDDVPEVQLLNTDVPGCVSSDYCAVVSLRPPLDRDRAGFMEALGRRGIGTSIYYPRPVPRMSYYQDKYGFSEEAFAVASAISRGTVALPVGPHLDDSDMTYLCEQLREVCAGARSYG